MQFRGNPAARFWSKVNKGDPAECWEWTAYKDYKGYARLWFEGRMRLASHVSLFLAGKARPDGLCALHGCDNPACVNPAHLRWGTHKENMTDKSARGRCPDRRGRKHPMATLDTPENRWLKFMICAWPECEAKTAPMFGVSHTAIGNIRNGKTWGHIPLEIPESANAWLLEQARQDIRAGKRDIPGFQLNHERVAR